MNCECSSGTTIDAEKARVETLVAEFFQAAAAERHLTRELFRQGRPAGELPLLIESLDRITTRREEARLALMEATLGLTERGDRDEARAVIRGTFVRTHVRVEAPTADAEPGKECA